MIITAQLFFNEIDLLLLNCRNLKGHVDAHVIVEAETTFTGLPKPLYFEQNRERFKEFNVIHRVIKLDPTASSPWDREGESHRKLLELVREVNPEIAIWSDADELVNPDAILLFREKATGECMTLDMDHLNFYFDRYRPEVRDLNGKIAHFLKGRANQPWRGETHWPIIYEAGWHMEYMGGREHLMAKLEAISHAPEPGCVSMRREVDRGLMPGLEISKPYPVEKLPLYVQQNLGLYARYFNPQ